jgi:hypothetical protein
VRDQNDYAYVGTLTFNSIVVLDVRNKTNPSIVRTITANIDNAIWDITGDSGYLYAVSGSGYAPPSRLCIWSLANPSYPIYQGSCAIQEGKFHLHNALAVYGSAAYVGTNGGTYVVNVSNHSSPQVVSRIATTYGERLSIAQGVLHAANWNETRFWSLSNPLAPVLLNSITSFPANDCWQIAAQGQYDYSARQNSLFVTNASANPPTVTSSRSITPKMGWAEGIARKNNTLFVGAAPGIVSLNISNPTLPTPLQSVGGRWVSTMRIAGNYLYALTYWGFMEIWNIANPQNSG